MKKTLIFILAVLVVSTHALAQNGRQLISFEQLFPVPQQRQLGLQKLNAVEREALRAHVERLLMDMAVVANQPPAPMKGKGQAAAAYSFVGGGHWIKKNVDRGSFILLEDGSLWQIDPLEKLDASLWLPISNITVAPSTSGSPGFDYLLINTTDGEKAHAKYMGKQ